jgi:endo-1,4-beta-D-glucanase Y
VRYSSVSKFVTAGALVVACSAADDAEWNPATVANALSMAPSAAIGDAEVAAAYSDWKSRYVTSSGAGGNLRVQRTEDGNDTVSEGIGYGMVLSAYLRDRATFDGLWAYAKSHLDERGLMHWRINASNSVTGFNAATDGDEDMALGLIVASRVWGASYGVEARTLIDRILAHEVESGSDVLKPGDVWGGSSVTNPSYFAPAYYKVFATFTGNSRWNSVANRCYAILANIASQSSGSAATGLVPDWAQASGAPASGMSYDYRYDAARTPWRLAHDAAWYNDSRANAHLTKLNSFWRGVGIPNIRDGYTLSGGLLGSFHTATFVAMAASGAINATDSVFRSAMWNEAVRVKNNNYFNDSLRAVGLLFMADKMPNPLTMGGGSGGTGGAGGSTGGTGGTGASGGSGGTSGAGGTGGTCSASPVGSGTGLRGDYFNNMTLTAPVAGSRTESVNFNWGTSSPGVSGIGINTFSVRWSGQVQPRYSGRYRFCTTSDDGVRLWVGSNQLINNWTDHAATENCATTSTDLVAGTRYDIRMEFYENGGGASAELRWFHDSDADGLADNCTAKEIIPASQLYAAAGCTSNAACNDNNACTTDSCNTGTGTCSNSSIICNDNNSCTNDTCNTSSGCVFTNNGSCGTGGTTGTGGTGGTAGGTGGTGGTSAGTPCSTLCDNPVTFAGPGYQSGNLGTAATCHQTLSNLQSGNCSNLASPRVLTVNGVAMNCNGWTLPPKRNNGYCIQVNAGTPSWSAFVTW